MDVTATSKESRQPRWEKILFTTGTALVACYLALGIYVPSAPYRSDGAVLYPLLVLYKSSLLFHVSVFLFAGVLSVIALTNVILGKLSISTWGGGLLLVSCSLLVLIPQIILAPDYLHHDRVYLNGAVYQLGTSTGPDAHDLQYLVYRCDARGLVCRLVDVPHRGINRSHLPGGTQSDRSAEFLDADDGTLYAAINGETYLVNK